MRGAGEIDVDQLRLMADRLGDTVAYRDLDAAPGAPTSITFGEWDEQSNRMARSLLEHGVEKGDRVSIYLPPTEALRFLVAYAAVHKAGAVAVPTNTRLSVPELVKILGHAEVRACLTCAELLAGASAVREQVPSLSLVVSAGLGGDPIPLGGGAPPAGDAPPARCGTGAADRRPGCEVVAWDDALLADGSEVQVPVGPEDLADIMYTSGTTGLPKGVAVRHRNLAMIPNHEPRWTGEGWLHGAPMFTFAGIAFVYNPMKMGMVGLYLPRFDAERWMRAVEDERPTMAFIVPAMAELLVSHPRFGELDLSSLRAVSIGSAPLAPRTLVALQERLPGASVSNSYGLTEAGPAFIVMPKEDSVARIGSVGKPIPPMEIKVVGDAGTECEPREVGELLTRMPGRQREYYKDEDATASTWTPDGWLRSGDLAYLDEDGFLYVVGRKKDLIIRGGHNVHPTDVEAVLLEHPAVQEAAVVGLPHDVLGEDVGAYVVTAPGAEVTEEELRAFCAERLADYKRPRRLWFVPELPRNATGKVLKHELRARAAGRPGASS